MDKEERQHLEKLREEHRKRLRQLQLKEARFGSLHVPEYIPIEIKKLKQEIESITNKISALEKAETLETRLLNTPLELEMEDLFALEKAETLEQEAETLEQEIDRLFDYLESETKKQSTTVHNTNTPSAKPDQDAPTQKPTISTLTKPITSTKESTQPNITHRQPQNKHNEYGVPLRTTWRRDRPGARHRNRPKPNLFVLICAISGLTLGGLGSIVIVWLILTGEISSMNIWAQILLPLALISLTFIIVRSILAILNERKKR